MTNLGEKPNTGRGVNLCLPTDETNSAPKRGRQETRTRLGRRLVARQRLEKKNAGVLSAPVTSSNDVLGRVETAERKPLQAASSWSYKTEIDWQTLTPFNCHSRPLSMALRKQQQFTSPVCGDERDSILITCGAAV